MRFVYLIFYYLLACHLPKSTMPLIGKWAFSFRYWCCRHLFSKCGKSVNVENGAYIGDGKDFFVGNYVGIGKNFISHNRVVIIDDHLLMGEDVTFVGGVHDFSDTSIPIGMSSIDNNINRKIPLHIAGDVWIGTRAMVLPSCKYIGHGSIVGAGAVVTKDVPDWAIVGGNPARIIRMRK